MFSYSTPQTVSEFFEVGNNTSLFESLKSSKKKKELMHYYTFRLLNNDIDAKNRDCPNCDILMLDPVCLPCGHRICMTCIED